MASRDPLPRGPVTYAEEQMARLIGAVEETNRLLGQLLSQQQGEPPGWEFRHQFDPVQGQSASDPRGPRPPDSEVTRHDGPGAGPAKRSGRR